MHGGKIINTCISSEKKHTHTKWNELFPSINLAICIAVSNYIISGKKMEVAIIYNWEN